MTGAKEGAVQRLVTPGEAIGAASLAHERELNPKTGKQYHIN